MIRTYTYVRCPDCEGAILDIDVGDERSLWAFCPWCGRNLIHDDPERKRRPVSSSSPVQREEEP